MEFASANFVFIFLPASFILHLLIPRKAVWARNALLVLLSLVFYAWGGLLYVPVLVIFAALNFFIALLIARSGRKAAKTLLAAACVVDIGMLAVFKYSAFFVGTLNSALRISLPVPGYVSPIGLSFFTFQTLSYVIDSFRGEAKPTKNFLEFLLYTSLFAQIVQGPIIRWGEIEKELRERRVTPEGAAEGLRLFVIGLAMKVVLADTLGRVSGFVFSLDPSELNALNSWTGAFAFLLRLYFDFAGYSLMAVGIGKLFGFTIPENFNYPYIASSLTDFWRRWHMTLSRWFRDYVYIPLGGNRKGEARACLNKLTVFLLTGLWHGANWTFVLWGAYNGVIIAAEGLLRKRGVRLPKPVGIAYSLFAVLIGFAVFASRDVPFAFSMLRGMFTRFSVSPVSLAALSKLFRPTVAAVFAVSIPAVTPLPRLLFEKTVRKPVPREIIRYGSALALLALCLCFMASGSYHPSIYAAF